MALESELIKQSIVKEAEFGRQPTKSPYEFELRGNDVNDQTEPSLLGKLEAILGFTLDLNQRISPSQKLCVHVVAAVSRIGEVADLVRSLECATHQVTASPDMPRPWHNETTECYVCSGPMTMQTALFDQRIPELAELETT